MTERFSEYLVYPLVLGVAVLAYAAGIAKGLSAAWMGVLAIVLGVILINILEWRSPYRRTWKPGRAEALTDLLYTALIQVALPRLLALLAVFWLAGKLGGAAPLQALWPHHWAAWSQILLLILSADFLRYWLHRLSHTTPLLWRLHAVHHSPGRLYWLNTARFHPIEKALQFCLDSLPFLLMGVAPEIIGYWFVVYSVNGFFQHSNIRMRFAGLSGILSTAEMHRWHHSRDSRESNANYANVFILWDRLFGTYFRPRDREVGELGLRNRNYPMDFVRQMRAPFIQGLDSAGPERAL